MKIPESMTLENESWILTADTLSMKWPKSLPSFVIPLITQLGTSNEKKYAFKIYSVFEKKINIIICHTNLDFSMMSSISLHLIKSFLRTASNSCLNSSYCGFNSLSPMALPTTSREHSNNFTKLSTSISLSKPSIAISSNVSFGDDADECGGAADAIWNEI